MTKPATPCDDPWQKVGPCSACRYVGVLRMEGPGSVHANEYLFADSQNPCLACGACCAAFRVSYHGSESDEAVADAVPADMTCHVAPLLCAMKGTDHPHPWCIALHGQVGASVWCAIYGRRPSVCRELIPSGQDGTAHIWCDRARAIWGLPPLMPVLIAGQNRK
jgi:Fe-S-cluster containining protein